MAWQDRIIDDGTDRASWEWARVPIVGASDAAKLSKLESVPLYAAAKLAPKTFFGNENTKSGYRWEPMMLAWLDIPENKALIGHAEVTGWGATPDGIKELGGGRVGMAECKAKHGRIVYGPSLPEWRQVMWQFECVPEADWIEWAWVELTRNAKGEWDLRPGQRMPQSIRIFRDDPEVLRLRELVIPIATELSATLAAARRIEREFNQ